MTGSQLFLRTLVAVAALSLLAATPVSTDEISRAALLSLSCSGCHGTDGKSPGSIPTIGGKSAEFLASALRQFNSGDRPGTVMGRHATGYTDEEIDLIAAYLAGR